MLGTLPVNWAGVALIGLAFILFAAEVYVSGFGALGIGGAISLVAGGLILTSSSNPDFQVSRWLVVATGAIVAGFFALVVTTLVRARKLPNRLGVETMIGSGAITVRPRARRIRLHSGRALEGARRRRPRSRAESTSLSQRSKA